MNMQNNKLRIAFAKYLNRNGYITKNAAHSFPTRTRCDKGISAFGLEVFSILYHSDFEQLQKMINDIKQEK